MGMVFDKTEPVAGSYPNSAPMRDNFNALATHHIGGAPPPSPDLGYVWLDTAIVDNWKVKLYSQDGVSSPAWVTLFENAQANPRAIMAFTQLADVPTDYAGHGGKVVSVKGAEDGLEFTVGGMSAHALVGALHTASGLTPGEILTALTTTTFGFQAASGGSIVSTATYAGNGAANREITLDDDYTAGLIFQESPRAATTHGAMAHFTETCFGCFIAHAATDMRHYAQSGTIYFQGKVASTNKIKLGSEGAPLERGFNWSGWNYRILLFKA